MFYKTYDGMIDSKMVRQILIVFNYIFTNVTMQTIIILIMMIVMLSNSCLDWNMFAIFNFKFRLHLQLPTSHSTPPSTLPSPSTSTKLSMKTYKLLFEKNLGFLFVKTTECSLTNTSMVLLKIRVTNFMCES